jgi:4a-hydroxytetrahydrobiopterin dehydratase
MARELHKKKCIPCEKKGMAPLGGGELKDYMDEVHHWTLSPDTKKISREFTFKDFVKAMDFVSHVADIAEQEGHHPDIHIFYNKVLLELWTHAINGLSENDFILASKIDLIYE